MNNLVRDVLPTRPAKAEKLARAALEMRLKLLGDDHQDVAWSRYNLAYLLITRERFDEAETFLQQALAMRGSDLPDENPLVASCFLLLGRSRMHRGDLHLAMESFDSCYRLRKRTLADGHWLLSTTRSFIGECLIRLGDLKTGEALIVRSYEELRRKLGSEHEQTKQARQRMHQLGM